MLHAFCDGDCSWDRYASVVSSDVIFVLVVVVELISLVRDLRWCLRVFSGNQKQGRQEQTRGSEKMQSSYAPRVIIVGGGIEGARMNVGYSGLLYLFVMMIGDWKACYKWKLTMNATVVNFAIC